MLNRLCRLILVATLLTAGLLGARVSQAGAPRPRLVVVISIDQFRSDYLDRWDPLFLPPGTDRAPGGFRYLRERGAQFPAARYTHFPLFTGPGHAVILTGGFPYKTGIVGNEWYAEGKRVYCVDDPRAKVVGGSGVSAMSPANLRSSTVGDELKLATRGAAKVVTLSLKDRAAILLGGRMTDATIWFDDTTGRWISSDFYCKDGALPAWVDRVNDQRIPDSFFGKVWTDAAMREAGAKYPPTSLANGLTAPTNLGPAFPHTIDGGLKGVGQAYYKAYTTTPWANAYVLQTVREAIAAEKLGQDETPDLLALNLASNDYVGHAFGPDSNEVVDITVQTDRQLSEFFRYLEREVPGGLASVTIVVTADHGVCPVPEQMALRGFTAGRVPDSNLTKAAEDALDARFGDHPGYPWVKTMVEQYVYLDHYLLRKFKIDLQQAEKTAAEAIQAMNGVYAAYPRTQIAEGRLGSTDLATRLYRGFYPKLSGDVLVITDQFTFADGSYATTHGSPYAYDTSVPILLAGTGIRPGTYWNDACPSDIAPTLCGILGIERPSACDGHPLAPAMK